MPKKGLKTRQLKKWLRNWTNYPNLPQKGHLTSLFRALVATRLIWDLEVGSEVDEDVEGVAGVGAMVARATGPHPIFR